MRLRPRNVKRLMFSCAQCGKCLEACSQSHATRSSGPGLTWQIDLEAVRESLRAKAGPRSD
jgi:heterodisulfide reductase subunit C